MAEQKVAHLFLQNFIKEVIRNTPAKDQNIPDLEFYEVQKPFATQKSMQGLRMLHEIEKPLETMAQKNNFNKTRIIEIPNILSVPGRYQRRPIKKYNPPANYAQKNMGQQQSPQQLAQTFGSYFSKIQFLIKDPAVTEIECQGPDKNLLVRKAGFIQLTKVILTEGEIIELLNYFSTKTKIPMVGGTLKAAADNLIMTGIISEILGPRFIIQKRNPFQKLIPF